MIFMLKQYLCTAVKSNKWQLMQHILGEIFVKKQYWTVQKQASLNYGYILRQYRKCQPMWMDRLSWIDWIWIELEEHSCQLSW